MHKHEIAKQVLHEYRKKYSAPMRLACMRRELKAYEKLGRKQDRRYKARLRKRIVAIKKQYFPTPCASQG